MQLAILEHLVNSIKRNIVFKPETEIQAIGFMDENTIFLFYIKGEEICEHKFRAVLSPLTNKPACLELL